MTVARDRDGNPIGGPTAVVADDLNALRSAFGSKLEVLASFEHGMAFMCRVRSGDSQEGHLVFADPYNRVRNFIRSMDKG